MIGKISELKSTVNNLEPKLGSVFIPWAIRHPRYLKGFLRLFGTYKKVKKLRAEAKAQGLTVPPFLILSITSKCNLMCSGCYASACGTVSSKGKTMEIDQWKSIVKNACDIGVFGFVIAGGEPFTYPGLLELCEEFSDRLFLIFTNGTMLNENNCEQLRKMGNVIIFVSIEGNEEQTNDRRGEGVHQKAMESLEKLKKMGCLTGVSVTITKKNYDYWMDENNIDNFLKIGVKAIALMEYIPTTTTKKITKENKASNQPIQGDDHSLMLTSKERRVFRERILEFREKKSVYIVHSPGDEEFFGGCVSAGRGFAHVTPTGDLTPCPVSNLATHNLKTSNLQEALSGKLFEEIRKNEQLLETEGMPCALFAHPEEVNKLAKSVGAYKAKS